MVADVAPELRPALVRRLLVDQGVTLTKCTEARIALTFRSDGRPLEAIIGSLVAGGVNDAVAESICGLATDEAAAEARRRWREARALKRTREDA